MPSTRCPDCIQRLPAHGFHLCPARGLLRSDPPTGQNAVPERSDRTHHAAILREAGWSWDAIEGQLHTGRAQLQVAVSRRYPPRSRAA